MVTIESTRLRNHVRAHKSELYDKMYQYGASNLRIFGSVARGDATADSDIDFLVDIDPKEHSLFGSILGIEYDFSNILGMDVDLTTTQTVAPAIREDMNSYEVIAL
ncbi:nucleotidyltransferase [Bacteroidia bacterium]|nr:nucleotidyltransferase [Bacteroidia bacterium]